MKETPLIVAIEYKQIEMIRFLISSRADVQKPALQHRTPLFFVSDGESTQLLIKAGAQVNYKDDQDVFLLRIILHSIEQHLRDMLKLPEY